MMKPDDNTGQLMITTKKFSVEVEVDLPMFRLCGWSAHPRNLTGVIWGPDFVIDSHFPKKSL